MNGICLRHNTGRLRGSLFVYCGLQRLAGRQVRPDTTLNTGSTATFSGMVTTSSGRTNRRNGVEVLTVVAVLMQRPRDWRRPSGEVAQAHGAVERLVAQGQRGHGAAAAAGTGSRRL